MADLKSEMINRIVDVEGGYVDDPSDSGGATKYGITESVARANSYTGNMRDLPRHVAFDIYSDKYWDKVNADRLNDLSELIAYEVVDTAVNTGVKRAGEFLQRSLNAMNRSGSLYGDLVLDGSIGPATINALTHYLEHREELILVRAMNCLQGAFYIELAERREKDEAFVYGWIKNRVEI